MPKQLLESVHSDRFCRVQNLPTSSVELIWPITELYFRQILSTDFMNRFYQDVNTGPDRKYKSIRTKCGLTRAHLTHFPNRFLVRFCRAHAGRTEPVFFSRPTENIVPPQQKSLEITTPTLNLRSKAFPSSGEACPLLGVPPRWQNARISTI